MKGRNPKPRTKSRPQNKKRSSSRDGAGDFSRDSAPKLARAKGRFVAGIHACREVLRVRPHEVHAVYLKNDWQNVHDLKQISEICDHNDVAVETRKDSFFNQICATHQGVVMDVLGRPKFSEKALGEDKSLVLILDEIEDPHNLGAILRTAWLMSAKAVFITDKRSATLTATAAKVACGGAEHVPVVVEKSLQVLLGMLKEKGYWVYGLAGEADAGLWDVEFSERTAIVVGAEDKGIRASTRNFCDQLISIPQAEAAASFNASVATAIAVSEVQRQWLKG